MSKDIQSLLDEYGVKSCKETRGGLVAIHKQINGVWYWLYFRFDGKHYCMTGSTRRFED
jgi:hypothetical protein